MDQLGIGYTVLDRNFLFCEEAQELQETADSLRPEKIDGLFRKWLERIAIPPRTGLRAAGFGVNDGISNVPYLQKRRGRRGAAANGRGTRPMAEPKRVRWARVR